VELDQPSITADPLLGPKFKVQSCLLSREAKGESLKSALCAHSQNGLTPDLEAV
jgi:hypothetical protein